LTKILENTGVIKAGVIKVRLRKCWLFEGSNAEIREGGGLEGEKRRYNNKEVRFVKNRVVEFKVDYNEPYQLYPTDKSAPILIPLEFSVW